MEVHRDLTEAARLQNVSRLKELAAGLAETGDREQALADHLSELVAGYDLAAVRSLIDELGVE